MLPSKKKNGEMLKQENKKSGPGLFHDESAHGQNTLQENHGFGNAKKSCKKVLSKIRNLSNYVRQYQGYSAFLYSK